MPLFVDTYQADNEADEICISWLKPEGGNEIDNYIVRWIIMEDNLNYSDTIPYNGMDSNTFAIKSHQPAQAVNVSIRASNSAGESEASWKVYITGKFFPFATDIFLLF